MASGTITLSSSKSNFEAKIVWSSKSNGTEANNSTVTASLQIKRNDGYTTTGTWSGSLNIGGTVETFSVHRALGNSWYTACEFSIKKAHSADGKGSCYIYGKANAPSGTSLEGVSASGSKTVTLDTIPRQATITNAPNFNDTQSPTISYSNPAGNSVTSLEACISLTGAVDDVKYRAISKTGSSYTFDLTQDELNNLYKATLGSTRRTVKFYVRTVINGVTYLSSLSKTFSIVNAFPKLNPTAIDSNATTVALTGDNSKFVKYYSNAKVTIGAAAVKGATLTSKSVSNGANASSTDTTFNKVESASFTFMASDNRNLTTKQTLNKTLVNYVKLTCKMVNNTPTVGGAMTVACKGNSFNGSFGAVTNTLSVYYRYKASGGAYSGWKAMTVSKSGNTYSATASLTGLDYQTTYVFQCYATDKLATVNSTELSVRATPVFDWGKDEFSFHVPVTMDNAKQLYFKSTSGDDVMMISLNNSNQSFFGYGGYNAGLGSTYFDGNSVYMRSKNGISMTAAGTIGGNKAWTNSSDIRLKKDLTTIPKELINVWMELEPKLFKWNELSNSEDNLYYFGLVAQEVIEAFNKYGLDYKEFGFVATIPVDGVDYYALTYDAYHILTAQVLKNTISEVNSIREEIAELKALV